MTNHLRSDPKTFDDDLVRQVEPLEGRISSITSFAGCLIAGGFVIFGVSSYANTDGFTIAWISALFQGPIAAVWALAGVLLIYVAFLGQRLQLLYQQQELRDTRAELRGQREEFQIQNETAKRQRFENTFFHLLTLHHEIVRASSVTDFGDSQRQLSGRNAFDHLWFRMTSLYTHAPKNEFPTEMQRVEAAWYALYSAHRSVLGHYFRNLYHVFKYVKRSDAGDKRWYTSLARAQLSDTELCLLFYNCAVGQGKEKFLPLANEFELFDNLLNEDLLDSAHESLSYQKLTGSRWPIVAL